MADIEGESGGLGELVRAVMMGLRLAFAARLHEGLREDKDDKIKNRESGSTLPLVTRSHVLLLFSQSKQVPGTLPGKHFLRDLTQAVHFIYSCSNIGDMNR